MRKLIALLITGYQKTFSPDHGPLRHLYPNGYCRHSPTCSQYAQEVILERGVVIGGLLTLKRLLSCHPWKQLDEKKIKELTNV
jgi:putative membrane protein insertion efficiency factor